MTGNTGMRPDELRVGTAKEPTGRRRVAIVIVLTVLVCLPVLGLAQYIAHVRYDETDQWLFACYGRQITQGRVLYEQLWDNKPPGIFWTNAVGLWLAGGSPLGPIALCAAASVGACAAVFATARRLYGWSAAGVITVLASVYLFGAYYHVGCNRPITYCVLAELAAFLLYCRSFESAGRSGRNLLLAGSCAGVSFCFLQTGMAVALGIGLHILFLVVTGRLSGSRAGRRLATFVGGWALTVGAAVGLLALTSDLGWAWDAVFGFNLAHKAPGGGGPAWFGQREHEAALALPVILAAATLAHPIVRWLSGFRAATVALFGRQPPGLLFVLWAWMVVAIALALAGPDRRLHYWGIALPPLIMLAGHGVHLLFQSGRGTERPVFHVVVAVVWMAYMLIAPLRLQVQAALTYRWHAADEMRQRRIADPVSTIRRCSMPGETLFVWGYDPRLYWLADRPSAIRYIGTEKTSDNPAGQRLLGDICGMVKDARPRIVVADPAAISSSADDFAEWLRGHYTRPDPDRAAHVWVRND